MPHQIIPTETFRRGVIHQTIAHAVWCLSNASLAYEISWDNNNYNRQDSMGKRASMYISKDIVVGGFYDVKCKQAQSQDYTANSWQKYFRGAPETIVQIAETETTQYLLDDLDSQEDYPYLTTAFWQQGEYLVSLDSYEDFINNGGSVISYEIQPLEIALQSYTEEYLFSATQLNIINKLYHARINATEPLEITLKDIVASPNLEYKGLDECKELLASIGITFIKKL